MEHGTATTKKLHQHHPLIIGFPKAPRYLTVKTHKEVENPIKDNNITKHAPRNAAYIVLI